jgi:hypothetical protein
MIVNTEELRRDYAQMGVPTNAVVRGMLRQWVARNNWTWQQIATANQIFNHGSNTSPDRLQKFVASGKDGLHLDALRAMRRFLLTFPNPSSFEQVMSVLEETRDARTRERQERLRLAPIEREQERAAHIRRHLAQERAPRRSLDRGPLFGLDKATIAALSGVGA